ncbi:GAF and ANTAR domain-containing protein, partial [bacterium]|nr:GAF and ANTAR domain-containing protein [bacterium]
MSPQTTYAKRLKALQEISKTIVSDLYLDDILRLIVTVTAEVMGSKICSLWFLEEKELRLRATQAIDEEYIRERTLKLGEGIVGIVAQQKKPMKISDVSKEPKYKEKRLAKKLGLCSMLSVPMKVKGKVVGVINSYTSTPHRFTKAEIETLTAVANQAAIVIENTQLMVKSKVIQEELETRKVAEKAKGILMKESGLTEEEAYRRIQKKSM